MTDQKLNEHDLERFRSRLEGRREELKAHLEAQLAESDADRAEAGAPQVRDTKDISFLAAMAEVRLAGREREVQEVRDIEAALARIDGGVFGICSDCAEPIPEARLDAYPTAKRCRDCQEAREAARQP